MASAFRKDRIDPKSAAAPLRLAVPSSFPKPPSLRSESTLKQDPLTCRKQCRRWHGLAGCAKRTPTLLLMPRLPLRDVASVPVKEPGLSSLSRESRRNACRFMFGLLGSISLFRRTGEVMVDTVSSWRLVAQSVRLNSFDALLRLLLDPIEDEGGRSPCDGGFLRRRFGEVSVTRPPKSRPARFVLGPRRRNLDSSSSELESPLNCASTLRTAGDARMSASS